MSTLLRLPESYLTRRQREDRFCRGSNLREIYICQSLHKSGGSDLTGVTQNVRTRGLIKKEQCIVKSRPERSDARRTKELNLQSTRLKVLSKRGKKKVDSPVAQEEKETNNSNNQENYPS
ncbi:hypothetical protein OROMI_027680 [Orobanche minor]